jgi:hypothetical protein
MASNKISGADASELLRFLRYSAVVTEVLSPALGGKSPVPIPFLYALLAGLNELLLRTTQQNSEEKEDLVKIGQADLVARLMSRQRWVGTDAQLKATIDKLNTSGFLKISGEVISILPPMHEMIISHAKSIYTFLTGNDLKSLSELPLRRWLDLNNDLFSVFFFDDFGRAWRDLRHDVNEKLKPRGLGSRSYNRDSLNENPTLWAVLNVLIMEGPATHFRLGSRIEELGLQKLAPTGADIEKAANNLVTAGVLESDNKLFTISPEFEQAAVRLRYSIERGLPRMCHACEEWARQL